MGHPGDDVTAAESRGIEALLRRAECTGCDETEPGLVDGLCKACREMACDNCGESLGVRDLAWDAARAWHLCKECERKANAPSRREIEEARGDAAYDQAKDDRMEKERGR